MDVLAQKNGEWIEISHKVLDLYGSQLGPEGLAVYLALLRHSSEDSWRKGTITYQEIAAVTGMTSTNVVEGLKRIIDLHLVDVMVPLKGRELKIYQYPVGRISISGGSFLN